MTRAHKVERTMGEGNPRTWIAIIVFLLVMIAFVIVALATGDFGF